MAPKFNKFYIVGLAILCTTVLSGCESERTYIRQGYTQKVIFDLGEGEFKVGGKDNYKVVQLQAKPGTPIPDISQNKKYELYKYPDGTTKYVFEGWYTDKTYTTKVDFDNYVLPETKTDEIRFYAKWDEVLEKYFEIYYKANEAASFAKVYEQIVNVNKKFTINKDVIKAITNQNIEDYTLIDAYQDEAMTKVVDDNYVLTDALEKLPIYISYNYFLQGKYHIASTAKELQDYFSRYSSSSNLYLKNDIDLNGETLLVKNLNEKKILGNNHKIINFTYETKKYPNKGPNNLGGLFSSVENVEISDLTIENAKFHINSEVGSSLYFAPFAYEIKSSKISNVNILGEVIVSEASKTHYSIFGFKRDQLAYQIDSETKLENVTVNLTEKSEA